jgi:UDP-N-acetylmuramoyl-tripeptide--D-alanyl-D-alanine ligase
LANITYQELRGLLNPKYTGNIKSSILKNVVIDSRLVKKGDIFVALIGKKYDAHNFIKEAVKNGAGLVVAQKNIDKSYPLMVVDSTDSALKKIAAFVFEKSKAKSIAVTGSSGKTTTKDLICAFLQKRQCCKTYKNENNFIGISKTLLSVDNKDVCVVEVGINHPKEMEDISLFLKPDIAVFINIGKSHLGNFGSLKNIAKEKTKLVSNKTKVIYNYDDLYLRGQFDGIDAVKFSAINPLSDVYIDKFEANMLKISIFGEMSEIMFNNDSINIYNILASLAAAKMYDESIKEDDINSALLNFKPDRLRMQKEIFNSVEFILDCYNANPDSMKYALSFLNQQKGKKLAILGDMLELGEFAEDMHKSIGEFVNSLECDLIAYGEYAKYIYDETKSAKNAYFFSNKTELIDMLKDIYRDYNVILIKGSRGMKMEEIFEQLRSDL